ncbi:MAG: outer membrane beta-barrel protein [Chlorobi bacterium]|nr:outer membrane beta-barrel protein [Chlorobiota bacterium]
MNLKTVSLAILAIFMAIPMIPAKSVAQDGKDNPLDPTPSRRQILVGPTVGIHRNYHSGGFRTISDPVCPFFEDGTGWGFAVGLSAEFLPSVDGRWGIIPRITFEQRPGQFRQELPDVPVLVPNPIDPSTPEVVDQTISTTSDITYSLLNVELMYKQEVLLLGDLRVGVLGGPAAQYIMGGTNRQVQDLDEPENARFINPDGLPTENNGRRLIFFDGDIPERNATRFSVKAGVQGEIGLFNNQWAMTPGIYYDYGLSNVISTEKWQLSSVIFQVDFRRAF